MKLINFSKSVLKNYTYLELMRTLVERLSSALTLITQTSVKQSVNTFITAVNAMDDAYKAATSSELTNPLADADTARDRAYGTISSVVNAMATSGVATLEQASAELSTVLKTYKVNTAAQFNEESGAILQLCQELDNHTTAIATLGLTAVYAELKTHNANVRTILKQRNASQAFDKTEVMKTHRATVDEAFNSMYDYLNAHLILFPSEELEQAVAVINKDINYVRQHTGQTKANVSTDGLEAPAESTPEAQPNPSTPEGNQNPPNEVEG